MLNKKCRTTNIPPDLDIWRSDPKINRGHLLVMTNLNVKYEHWRMVFKIISGNHLVYRPTDRPTNRHTDINKTIYPLFYGIKSLSNYSSWSDIVPLGDKITIIKVTRSEENYLRMTCVLCMAPDITIKLARNKEGPYCLMEFGVFL